MKTLLTLFVLLFSSSVLADDISDFQIEGMSVGDSLLKYLSKKEIISKTDFEKEQGNNKEMAVIYFNNKGNFKNYRRLKVWYETKDKNYIITSLIGFVDIDKDIGRMRSEVVRYLKELQMWNDEW